MIIQYLGKVYNFRVDKRFTKKYNEIVNLSEFSKREIIELMIVFIEIEKDAVKKEKISMIEISKEIKEKLGMNRIFENEIIEMRSYYHIMPNREYVDNIKGVYKYVLDTLNLRFYELISCFIDNLKELYYGLTGKVFKIDEFKEHRLLKEIRIKKRIDELGIRDIIEKEEIIMGLKFDIDNFNLIDKIKEMMKILKKNEVYDKRIIPLESKYELFTRYEELYSEEYYENIINNVNDVVYIISIVYSNVIVIPFSRLPSIKGKIDWWK